MLPLIASGFSIKNNTDYPDKIAISNVPAILLFFALCGNLIMWLLSNPTIPATTKAFAPPFSAVKYISQHKFTGNLLNDPGFGDVLMWNMDKPPLLFIDTRFDAYPQKITEDFMALRDCQPGWQKLIEQYHIAWIFLPTSAKLCSQLSTNPEWQTVYKDNLAQILIRQ